jgi:DNA-binding transcriptional LysR family regulator
MVRRDLAVNFKHLRTFVIVAEHGTVTEAAAALRLTQPAVSRRIDQLEHELGFALFERTGRRVQLTPRGERMLEDSRSLLSHVGTFRERAQALRQGELEFLNVVTSSEPIEELFPTFLHRLAKQFPGVKVTLIEADPSEHLGMLERGAAHLAATVVNVVDASKERFASSLLPQFQVLAACAPSLGIESADTIDVRRLADYPLLLPKTNFVTRILFDAACRLAGVRPTAFVESVSSHALLALAKAGHGVAIFPSIVRTDGGALQVMRVMQRHGPLSIAPAIVWAKERTPPRYAQDFSTLLAAHVLNAFPIAHPVQGLASDGAPADADAGKTGRNACAEPGRAAGPSQGGSIPVAKEIP